MLSKKLLVRTTIQIVHTVKMFDGLKIDFRVRCWFTTMWLLGRIFVQLYGRY